MHNSSYEIEYDPNKAKANIKKHGISFEEASSALLDENALVQEDRTSKAENRWILIGFSNTIQLLTVVYTYREPDIIRIIPARKATKKESKYYA